MLLLIATICSPILPLFIGRKNAGVLIWIYPMVGFCIDVSVFILKNTGLMEPRYTPLFHNAYLLFEFVTLSTIYIQVFFKDKKYPQVFLVTVAILYIVDTLFNVWKVNFLFAGIFSLYYLLLSLAGFYFIVKKYKVFFLEKDWFFWFNVMVIVFAAGSSLLFLFINFLRPLYETQLQTVWRYFFYCLLITRSILLIPTIYFYKPITKSA